MVTVPPRRPRFAPLAALLPDARPVPLAAGDGAEHRAVPPPARMPGAATSAPAHTSVKGLESDERPAGEDLAAARGAQAADVPSTQSPGSDEASAARLVGRVAQAESDAAPAAPGLEPAPADARVPGRLARTVRTRASRLPSVRGRALRLASAPGVPRERRPAPVPRAVRRSRDRSASDGSNGPEGAALPWSTLADRLAAMPDAPATPPPARYDDLRAVFVNCTLKPSSGADASHTETLIERSRAILRDQGVTVETIRAADHAIAPGVQPDMTEHGADRDDWPALFETIRKADILVLASPIWLGERSSVCTRVVERLYAHSSETNDKGQYLYYGKVGGCLVTGNEDGIKHVAMGVLYSLQHLGYTIPPQADAGWIGEAGPGPSYGDAREDGPPVGFDNAFTARNTAFMTWNLLHMARMLKDVGGVPAYGNVRAEWDTRHGAGENRDA